MKRFLSFVLAAMITPTMACASVTKVDSLRSLGSISAGTTAVADSKAILDLVSTTKGMLAPRLTTAQRNAIASPSEGLTLFDTDINSLYFYTGAAWLQTASVTGTETLTNKTMSGSSNTFTNIPLATAVTGTLAVANGGTGQTSYTDGQLLIGNTSGNTLAKSTLTAGTGISITNGAGAITITNTAGATPVAMTVQTFVPGNTTWTRPSPAPLHIRVRMVGGGGGGACGGSAQTTAATSGTGSTFGLASVGGGTGPAFAAVGGAGGTAALGGYSGMTIVGGTGSGGGYNSAPASAVQMPGGSGGNTPFGGGGGGGHYASNGNPASANSGSGGGGGGAGSGATSFGGSGGGAGGYAEFIIPSPASSYSLSVGSQGTGGVCSGTSNGTGAAGGAGYIIVEEFYQ